jgi:enoyl-CoA hydratase/carnithine racemase
MTASKHVLFGEQSYGPFSIGTIELARPEALNALSTAMLASIESRLREWASDPAIACVFLHSENPKAFCAGGDVKFLGAAKVAGEGLALAREFFTQEYFTDYFVHTFPKPMVAWLDGICMGGGIGLTQGASHCVVTEKTVMAMPEVHIGFFPDVGASKFLSGLRGGIGIYLGLTGRRFSGATAASIGLVKHLLPTASKRQVVADLARLPWTGKGADDRALLTQYFNDRGQLPKNEFSAEWPELENIFARGDFAEIVKAIGYGADGRKGSLLSQAVFYRLVQQNKGLAWPDVFAAEWSAAINFCADSSGVGGLGEFGEGVRALLIDKDGTPKWPERSIAQAWDESGEFLRAVEPNLLRERVVT